MTNKILKSSALVAYVEGENLIDVQILIDDRQLFNALPGKYERYGIKTLASWPFFVTAVLNEPLPKGNAASIHEMGGA
jgi:hypothetical protein